MLEQILVHHKPAAFLKRKSKVLKLRLVAPADVAHFAQETVAPGVAGYIFRGSINERVIAAYEVIDIFREGIKVRFQANLPRLPLRTADAV